MTLGDAGDDHRPAQLLARGKVGLAQAGVDDLGQRRVLVEHALERAEPVLGPAALGVVAPRSAASSAGLWSRQSSPAMWCSTIQRSCAAGPARKTSAGTRKPDTERHCGWCHGLGSRPRQCGDGAARRRLARVERPSRPRRGRPRGRGRSGAGGQGRAARPRPVEGGRAPRRDLGRGGESGWWRRTASRNAARSCSVDADGSAPSTS